MYLLGAKEFIKMPTGTFYVQYWENTKDECLQIIDKFKKNPKELITNDLEVYGDNYGSMTFLGDKEDNYIWYYDANVVGDACPSTTLYLVIDENELPDFISINDYEDNVIQLKKQDIIRIRDIFINEVYGKSKIDVQAIEELDKLLKENNSIVDTKIEGVKS